eukprot:UN05204
MAPSKVLLRAALSLILSGHLRAESPPFRLQLNQMPKLRTPLSFNTHQHNREKTLKKSSLLRHKGSEIEKYHFSLQQLWTSFSFTYIEPILMMY